jgi:hypothetical protein
MTPRTARAAAALLLLAAAASATRAGTCAAEEAPAGPGRAPAAAATPAVAPVPAPRRGASPGDERGPGGFVSRRDHGAETFYGASGGQLWYYLNLYYWVEKPTLSEHGPKDLWIREEVVETVSDLRRWPKGDAVPAPEPKTTLEYWKVGVSGRTITIDNHKDFWLESADLSSGRIRVSMTLTVGRLERRGEDGRWRAPAEPYVLERRNYGPKTKSPPPALRFAPIAGEPVNIWAYAIEWNAAPAKFTRSNWIGLPVPEIRLESSEVPPRPAPAVTDDRR